MSVPEPAEPRLFTRAFVALGVAELAYFTAAGLLIAITPLFVSGPLGGDEVAVGITVGAFSVTALLLRPWSGRAADTSGRRPLLVGGAFLCALAIAGHVVTSDLAVLIALRLVLGVAEALFFVAGITMLADLAPPGREGEAISFNSLALYLGIAFGPSIGELLLEVGGFTLAWVGGTGLALAAGALAMVLPETGTRGAAGAEPARLIHRGAVGPSLGLFTGIVTMAGFLAFATIYAREDLGMAAAGPALLTYGLVVVGCRIAFAKLPDRVPPYRLAAAALAAIGVGATVAGTLTTVGGLIAGAAIMGIGVAFVTPAFFTAIARRVRPAERGAALGTLSIFLDLAFGGGPVLLGFVAGAAGIPAAFLVAGAVAFLGAIGTTVAAMPRRATVAA